jgi:hypothetical protein
MDDNYNELEPPLKVGSGNHVVESSTLQQPVVNNDGETLNPDGRVVPEARRVPTLIKPKKITKISTFNIRTAKDDWRIHELVSHMEKQNISIVGLQEHRRVHTEELLYKNMDKHLLVTSSAWRNNAQAATGGVGIIMNKAAEQVLSDVTKISDRIIKASFAGNPETTIIVAYSPTNVRKNREDVDTFYEQIRNAIDDTPPHNFLALLGDWNAKIGPAHIKFPHDKRTNENGTCLLELVCEKSLCITNTMYEKRIGKRWSFEDPKGNRYLLDYILVNAKWRNSILNSECYSSFASTGSDHRVVTARVRLSLRANIAPLNKKHHDWKALRYNEDIRANFTIKLHNKFEALLDESAPISEQYKAFTDANKFAADETLPTIKNAKQHKHCNQPTIVQARKKVDQLTKRHNTTKSRIVRKHLAAAKKNLQAQYQLLDSETLKQQIAETEADFHANNTAKAWQVVNKITNRKPSTTGKLKGKSPEERKQMWLNHFKNLLGTPDSSPTPEDIPQIFTNLDILDTEFTLNEIREAKKLIKEGKAPGEDGIMPETLKRIDVDEILLKFSNKLLIEGLSPEQLSTITIVPVPKPGDLRLTNNYRGISLTSLVSKLINRMILNRIQPALDPLLRGNQAGFRPGRSTTAQILALRRLLEGVRDKNLPAVLVFVDFCKAFDSINHATMFKILQAYGIPPQLVEAIKLSYSNLKAKIKSPDGETDYFKIFAGVMQGDTLAPFLFIVVLDYAMRKAINGREVELGFTIHHRRSSRYLAESICDLDFADDICLLSNEIDQARKLIHSVQSECRKVGLELNAKKTKAMYYNTNIERIDTIDGTEIKQALTDTGDQDFKYLGSWCDKTRDINTRRALAWQSLNKMTKIWKSSLDKKLKIQLFRATTETILLYGCPTWTLTQREEKALDGTYTRMLRIVHDVCWRDKIPNTTLYDNLDKITTVVRERRLKLAGHVYRDKSSPAHLMVLWDPRHGTASRGRPKTTFLDSLLKDTNLETTTQLGQYMSNKEDWHHLSSRRRRSNS